MAHTQTPKRSLKISYKRVIYALFIHDSKISVTEMGCGCQAIIEHICDFMTDGICLVAMVTPFHIFRKPTS